VTSAFAQVTPIDSFAVAAGELTEEYDREARLQDGRRDLGASIAQLRRLKEQLQEQIK
jgi:hypothetical protein